MKLVMPPATAAADSLARSPLCVRPGSRKCTWSSIMPGIRYLPLASITSAASRRRDARADLNDTVAGDQHVGVSHLALVDEARIADE